MPEFLLEHDILTDEHIPSAGIVDPNTTTSPVTERPNPRPSEYESYVISKSAHDRGRYHHILHNR